MINVMSLDAETAAIYPKGVDLHRDWEISRDGVTLEAFSDGKITIKKLLDYADLKMEWYVPSLFAIEFMNFIRLVLGEEPENSNPMTHYFFIDSVFKQPNVKPFFMARNIDYDFLNNETVVLCSREFSKSTLVTYLILYMAEKQYMPGFGKVNYGLYVSDSMRNGVKKMMGRIAGVYYESRYLQGRFEYVNFTQEEAVFVRNPITKAEIDNVVHCVEVEKKDRKFAIGRMKRTFKVDGLGCASSARGASNVLVRPQFVIIDDTVSSETEANSDIILESIESTIESDVRGGLSGTGYFMIIIGTPYNAKDPVSKRVEEGLMLPIVFPRAAKMPIDEMKEEEFESVWPDRHTYKKCRREYMMAQTAKKNGNKKKMRSLIQEHYLRTNDDEDRMISDSMMQWYKRVDLEKNLNSYNIYITTDFTTTGSDGSDLSCVMVWAVSSNSDYFLLDIALRKMEIKEQYDELFRFVNYYGGMSRGVTVGVETDGQQKAHIFALQEMMVKRTEFFTFAQQKGEKGDAIGIRSALEGGNKHWRFRMMLPQFQNKKIWFPIELKEIRDMVELIEEIEYATYSKFNSKYDDGVDGISQLGMIKIYYPAKNIVHKLPVFEKRKDGIWSKIKEPDAISAYESYV